MVELGNYAYTNPISSVSPLHVAPKTTGTTKENYWKYVLMVWVAKWLQPNMFIP